MNLGYEDFESCKSEIGITVGLIDSIIFICRVLVERDLSSENVRQALLDLTNDKDYINLIYYGKD